MSTYQWGNRLPSLHSTRVILRELEDRDASALFTLFSDPEVMRYWSSRPMTDRAQAVRLLEDIREAFWDRRLFQWGIALPPRDEIIGTCTLFHFDVAHRRAEVGFALARPYWGTGLASEALSAVLAFAFGTLGLHRVEADADPRNERSLRLLERHGFRREGVLRERYHVGDEIQDAVFLGLLRSEWTGRTPDGRGG